MTEEDFPDGGHEVGIGDESLRLLQGGGVRRHILDRHFVALLLF